MEIAKLDLPAKFSADKYGKTPINGTNGLLRLKRRNIERFIMAKLEKMSGSNRRRKLVGKLDEQVFSVLKSSGRPLTLSEIADQIGKPPKKVFKALQKLFAEGKISCDVKSRQYMVAKE